MIPLEIHPGAGIGPVRLGMHPAEVLAVFAEEQVYERWMGGNLNDALLFPGLRLHFTQGDGAAPLPNSILYWIVVHKREDAFLYGQPVVDWTRDRIYHRLVREGYEPLTPANGDIDVPGVVGLSFDAGGRLIWVEVERA